MKKILVSMMLGLAVNAVAKGEDIELYPNSAGYTFEGDDISTVTFGNLGPTRTVESWTLAPIATDRQGCYLSTPSLATASRGLVTIVISLKRTYLGTFSTNASLEGQPYANLVFKRLNDGANSFIYSAFPISLGILQRSLTVTPISQTPEYRTVYATDAETQTYSVTLPYVEAFTQGTIEICDIFRFTGMELQNIKVIVSN